MPRTARIIVKGDSAIYHVISRTALPGFVIGEAEKEELLKIIKHLSSIYFVEVLGFSLMGTHFHLLVKVNTGDQYSDDDIRERFFKYYGKKTIRKITDGQIPFFRNKWEKLSELVKEIKQKFSLFYNKKHGRKGTFWSERFKSVLLESGETLINCLAYIDLNPVRAGMVSRPEDYRWCSLGYHIQRNNKDNFLSLDFGLTNLNNKSTKVRLKHYRGFVYEKGAINSGKGKQIDPKIIKKERKREYELNNIDRFKYRTRYFTDSGIIGSKKFVTENYEKFKDLFKTKREKKPKTISGIDGIFSLKGLSDII